MNVIKVVLNPNTNPPLVAEVKYDIIAKGDKSKGVATKGKKIAVHYTGWLDKDGKEGEKFDSSVDRGVPFVFTLGAGFVIKGWDEGLVGMEMGEKRRLRIPYSLAYGSRSAGEKIPEYSNLIFEVQLVGMAG